MAKARPISPHLQIYRWYFTMALSIAHRASGSALAVGILLLTWWLTALAAGPESFARIDWLMDGVFGVLVLFGYSFVLFFHMCNGLRHLMWDTATGLSKMEAYQSGLVVVGAAAALTVLLWLAILIAH
ncbi:MAG: succinate dehydrogenase, cytochrome b556 subunit [Geminicoccaceae bacterium]|nr:succinate dehydrogenase, cytochrome b556 subunit [Geminicoccaceae bacterium]